jgi:hypothetical protein
MRPARLLVLVATALATAALTAPAAIAQNLEVLGEEPVGGVVVEVHHCPPVVVDFQHDVTGGCPESFDTISGLVLRQHLSIFTESVISYCDFSGFLARIGEDGLGYLTNQAMIGPSCGITPCDEAASSHATVPWPAGLFETAPHEEVLVFTFCVRALTTVEGSQGVPCTLVIDANPQASHTWQLLANDVPCTEGNGIEVTGHWVSLGQGIETIH